MNYQEKINYLNRYVEGTCRLSGLAAEAERWRQIAASTMVGGEMASGGGSGQRMQNAVVQVADIIADIVSDASRLRKDREEIKKVIYSAENRRHRMLLELRYINNLRVWEIANLTGKSEKWTRETLKKAVNNLKI